MIAAATPDDPSAHWGLNIPQVRKALAFIKRHGSCTADELVEWDRTHGRRLFNWDNQDAAEDWRRHEARLFLNRFRGMFEGMRVRAFVHIRKNKDAGIDRAAYYSVEDISAHRGMREQVVADITKRMVMLGSELSMWKLSAAERKSLFERLDEAMSGERRKSA